MARHRLPKVLGDRPLAGDQWCRATPTQVWHSSSLDPVRGGTPVAGPRIQFCFGADRRHWQMNAFCAAHLRSVIAIFGSRALLDFYTQEPGLRELERAFGLGGPGRGGCGGWP